MLRYLYLLRHAEAKEKQVGQDDIDRKLTPRGMREALLIGTYLFKEKTKIDVIISSPAERAKATAGLVVDGLKWDHKTITFNDELYEASSRTFFNFLFTLDDAYKHIMLIAHNPVVSYVAEYLTKEEIREEGWKAITPDNDKYIKPETFFFEKGNYFLVVRFNNKIPFLDFILRDPAKETDRVKDAERFRFFCECKDINTFRYICKLLNIK